jgi:hypothetical protein
MLQIMMMVVAATSATRRVNWYLSSGNVADNAMLIADHGDAISGGYLCCGFGGFGADGAWKSMATAMALAQQAPLTGAVPPREVWWVTGVDQAALRSGAWSRGLSTATAALAPLAAVGLRGLIVDYEPAENYTQAHAHALGDFLGGLAAAVAPLNLSVGMDIAGWGLLDAQFWPAYLGRGLTRFTSMTPTYDATNVTEDKVFVAQAMAALPAGTFAAGVGTVLTDEARCGKNMPRYLWTEATFEPFVNYIAGAGVTTIDVWRCDIDLPYPAPDPTAPWYFAALSRFLAG